ncbi:MAG: ATP-binding protein [Acidimicrobiales bacterium]
MLCPVVVGRDQEQALLRARVEGLAQGRGGVVVLVGEAGACKSRLARHAVDVATALGIPVLAGRAVPGASPLPYRPLTEAFLAAFRSTPPPDDPTLTGFASHLGRLVPEWRTGSAGADESPVLLGEAVVRLLALHGDGRGSVLVIEDVHWADAETLEVLDGAKVIAAHGRARKGDEVLVLDHYLEVLALKPGAMLSATPLARARAAGAFTATHERFWVQARRQLGDRDGTKAIIEVLLAHRLLPADAVIAGMSAALTVGCVDPAVVVIEARKHAQHATAAVIPIGALARFDRPPPTLGGYDDLLEAQ